MSQSSFLLACSAILLALAAHAQQPDLTTPDVQKLKSEAVTQRAEITKQYTDALRKLVDDQLEATRQALAKAKVSGNITATASGTAAVKIFSDVKAAFEKDGSTAVTGKIRTDLEAMVEEFKRNAQAVTDKQTSELKKMNRGFAARLGEILARQKTPVPDEAKQLELWLPLLNAAAATPAATNAAAPAANAPAGTNAAVALPATSAVLQSHGDSASWTPLMKLEVTVRDSLEIVTVPLAGITAPKSMEGVGGMGNAWQVQITPFQELVPGSSTPAFRIQSVSPFRPLDVAVWPNSRNDWTIDLRAKADKIPSRHAVILEIDAAACKPLAGGAPAVAATAGPAAPVRTNAPAQMIKVRFESQPDGAFVLVNNQPLTEQGKPLLTPCDSTLPATPADITFRKRGYKDNVLRQNVPVVDKPFHVTLVEAAGFSDVTVPVPATSATEWTPTGVRVRKGNQVRITASGTWSCASDGELVNAEGYPNNDTYFKYYIDPLQNPRISSKANYGQLLARILPDGEIAAVGRQGAFTAAADGEVALAINEPLKARKDNRGSVKARIMVDP